MRPFVFLVLLVSAIMSGCFNRDKSAGIEKNIYRDTSKHDDYSVRIKIPTEWIEKLRRFDYSKNTKVLLTEFDGFIKPDTLVNSHTEHVADYGGTLNPMFIDLDGEAGEELICLLGWDIGSPALCVFKQLKGNWYLLYLEDVWMFNTGTEFSVANNFSKNKTFYVRTLYNRGSGVYSDGYNFYKLINNKVFKCLNLINEARIYGWGLYMNQSVKTNFKFSGDGTDQVAVNYIYNFFPGSINRGDCSWCANEDISLLKGDDVVYYEWDKKSLKYKLDIPSYENRPEDLTAKKIACFGDFGNDSLLVIAFADQIKEAIKNGTPQQKRILKEYIAKVKKNKTATTHELEKKSEAGGTKFYGDKGK